MKKFTKAKQGFIAAFILVLISSCDKKLIQATYGFSLSDSQVERIKHQTAILILPSSEYKYIDDYRELVPKAWTLSPIEVVKYSDVDKYAGNTNNSYISLAEIKETTTSGTHSYTNTHYYLTLSSPTGKVKKDKMETEEFCRNEMYPDFRTTVSTGGKKDVADRLYIDGSFRNFTLPYILSYLRFMQKNIESKTSPSIAKEYTDDNLRSRLHKDTLFIPEDLVYSRNKFTGKEEEWSKGSFAAYKGPYKIISTQELINRIKSGNPKKPLFLFEYVLSSSTKFISVWDVNSGTIVYRRNKSMTYNLKDKDLERIID